MPIRPPADRLRAYAAALLFAAIAVALRFALDPWLGDAMPWVSLFPAVTAAVWVGGAGPGVAAAIVGLLACAYFFVPPRGGVFPTTETAAIVYVAFAVSSGIVIALGAALRRERDRAAALRSDLSQRLEEITAASDLVPAAIFLGDATARHILGNRAACRLLGLPEGSNVSVTAPAGAPRYRAFRDGEPIAADDLPMQRAAREGVTVEGFEHDLVFEDGRRVTLLGSAAPLFDAEGGVRGVLAVAVDVSELHRSREELVAASERFEAFLANAPTPAFLKDFAGRYVYVNRALERLFDAKNEDWIGHTDHEIFAPEIARAVIGSDDAVRERLAPMQFVEAIDTPAGRRQFVANKFPVHDAHGALFVGGVALDATDRIQMEEALRASEQRFRAVQELSLDGFTILRAVRGADGRVADFEWTFVNAAAGRILRQEPDALVGRRLLEVLPGNRARSDLFDHYVRVVESGEPHDIELFYEADGIRGWFRNMAVRLDDGVAVSFADITARKELERELRARTDALTLADRRKSEFLAVLAHELRNPLGVLVNGLDYLEASGSGGPARVVQLMRNQLATMQRLVDDLLDANRIAQGKLELRHERLEVAAIVAQATEAMLRRADQAGVRIGVSLPREPLHVRGDAVRLAQALGNLLDNACKFTPPGGTVEVSAAREDGDVVLRVRDDGAGIAPEELSRVFDLFAQGDPTARVARRGLGVGLALVRRLVEMHGGRVAAHSEGPGHGSTFAIHLPADPEPQGQSALDNPATTSSA